MSTKVFSTRLDEKVLNDLRLLGKSYQLSLPKTIQILVEKNKPNEQNLNDPWKEFAGQISLDEDFEELIKNKRAKNEKIRNAKKSLLNV